MSNSPFSQVFVADLFSDWRNKALCADHPDPDLWFPDTRTDTNEMRRICRSCPVQKECLAYSEANNEVFGTYGALTEQERFERRRHRLQKERATR